MDWRSFFIGKDADETVAGIMAALVTVDNRFRMKRKSLVFNQLAYRFKDKIHLQGFAQHIRKELSGEGIQDG